MNTAPAVNTAPAGSVILVTLLVLAVIAVVTWVLMHRKRQSQRLQRRFGPEYQRTVQALGGQSKAEEELRQREARVAQLRITPLSPADAERFSRAWARLQGRFVDAPRGAVAEADKLVRELMTKRGYPMADFERRASDISVDHPGVVESYRAAHAIAARDARGEADTEELRKAIVHYRTLFADLLEVKGTPATERAASKVTVPS